MGRNLIIVCFFIFLAFCMPQTDSKKNFKNNTSSIVSTNDEKTILTSTIDSINLEEVEDENKKQAEEQEEIEEEEQEDEDDEEEQEEGAQDEAHDVETNVKEEKKGKEKKVKTYYTVALSHFEPRRNASATFITNYEHLKNLIYIMKKIHTDLDIIVMPEFSLTSLPPGFLYPNYKPYLANDTKPYTPKGYTDMKAYISQIREGFRAFSSPIPSLDTKETICIREKSYPLPIYALACAALDNHVYVVANLYEAVYCDIDCPDDFFFLYNTNVVFDREGRLIAKYRKKVTNEEPWLNNYSTDTTKFSFKTDFNVTFGLLIGDDVSDQSLAKMYKDDNDITDVILTTSRMFYNVLAHSAQDHAAWAYKTDLKLLVAGNNWDGPGGIYIGKKGQFKQHFKKPTIDFVIVDEVPKNYTSMQKTIYKVKNLDYQNTEWIEYVNRQLFDNSMNINEFDDLIMKNHELPTTNSNFHQTLCITNLCCEFNIVMTHNNPITDQNFRQFSYSYRIVALRFMLKTINNVKIGIEFCAVLACKNGTLASCGHRYSPTVERNLVYNPTTFESVLITRKAKTLNAFFGPMAMAFQRQYLRDIDFFYGSGQEVQTQLFVYLKKPTNDLMAFGINGRLLETDNKFLPLKKKEAEPSFYNSAYFILILFVVILLIFAIVCYFAIRACKRYQKRRDEVIPFDNSEDNITDEVVTNENRFINRFLRFFRRIFGRVLRI